MSLPAWKEKDKRQNECESERNLSASRASQQPTASTSREFHDRSNLRYAQPRRVHENAPVKSHSVRNDDERQPLSPLLIGLCRFPSVIDVSEIALRAIRLSFIKEKVMRKPLLAAALLATATAMPLAAQAQQRIIVEEGVTTGLAPGVGIIAEDERPRFRQYIVQERIPSYSVEIPVRVGTVLPESGVTYYDVPQQYGATNYRYTVVNDRPILVEPRTRRVMQVID